ncbi:universal stress protein [Nonomuraea sp. SYSU D8015]|uniref:universal stress protein n=1 Tax=Nonomuraea sp. SYSU D8015 TaxID=2593644 RepID=UPI0016606B00|nr:universal stress protein [Nonomuraea sp. SYSU D8015]
MTIVAGYVPTPLGEAVLGQALAEAELRKARLVVVNVSHPGAYVDPGTAPPAELQRRVGDGHEVRQPQDTDPAAALLDVARQESAELIVIGVRRRSPVGKLLMGSTAQRVLLESDCPVLAVKDNDHR